ncbi:MAG: gamma-glutamyltransferase [bacterium]|nr:gamma-glutamyltransferase family protein [Acidimicrobiia bacterium]MCY4650079.1 gamma-glutamyltransferase [bacterium]
MNILAVSGPSQRCAEAGASLARAGGNAVDAALSAMMVALVTEIAVIGPGAGGFVTVGGPHHPPVVYDGAMAMPGLGLDPDRVGGGGVPVHIGYGGGVDTIVGPGSVAVPGGWAAMGEVWQDYGHVPWREIVAPALDHARRGFPLGSVADYYLNYSFDPIFSLDPRSRAALHNDNRRRKAGELIWVRGLADALAAISSDGVDVLYQGDLGEEISRDLLDRGGIITRRDLREYRVQKRSPILLPMGEWTVALNPPPAVGGVALAGMLAGVGHRPPLSSRRLVEAQMEVLGYRRSFVDDADDWRGGVGQMSARMLAGLGSPSTVNISAVDASGLACAVTLSCGYGSGVIAGGSGMWMNNSLGEIELTGGRFHGQTPGQRLMSNMAPTVLWNESAEVVAAGSPGADRITTALQSTLLSVIVEGSSLAEAVERCRAHVEHTPGGWRLCYEEGFPVNGFQMPLRAFEGRHMFFGGVSAASVGSGGDMEAVADSRRVGKGIVV